MASSSDFRKSVLEAVSLSDDLPTLPVVVLEVTNLLNDTSSTPGQVTEIIKSDQVLTSKILKMVNSAYYAVPGGISSVERAVVFLGYNTIIQLMMGVGVAEFSRFGGDGGIDIREFWKHSLGVAVVADVISRHIGYASPEQAFAAGLLHDMGKLGLTKISGKRFGEAVEYAVKRGVSLRESEREHSLPTHDLVGKAMAGRWRFPTGLLAVINSHHQSFEARSQIVPPDYLALVDIVILANTLCKRFEIGSSGDTVIPDLDKGILERLNILRTDLPKLKGEMTRKIEDAKVFLELLGGDV